MIHVHYLPFSVGSRLGTAHLTPLIRVDRVRLHLGTKLESSMSELGLVCLLNESRILVF